MITTRFASRDGDLNSVPVWWSLHICERQYRRQTANRPMRYRLYGLITPCHSIQLHRRVMGWWRMLINSFTIFFHSSPSMGWPSRHGLFRLRQQTPERREYQDSQLWKQQTKLYLHWHTHNGKSFIHVKLLKTDCQLRPAKSIILVTTHQKIFSTLYKFCRKILLE